MDSRILAVFFSLCLPWLAPAAHAAIIAFEDIAPAGGRTQVTTETPYLEAGFTLIPETRAFIFDSAFPIKMIGNDTDWYSIDPGANSMLSSESGPFDLLSVLIGPTTGSESVPIAMTITGTFADGTILSQNFSDLLSATTATFDWLDLSSVTFSSYDRAGIDDINVQQVAEPSMLLLFGLGLILLGYKRKLMA
jgi:hypothetical protein